MVRVIEDKTHRKAEIQRDFHIALLFSVEENRISGELNKEHKKARTTGS